MILTQDEIEEGAKRLAKASADRNWDEITETQRVGFRMVVIDLAAELKSEHSPEAVHVFLTWMGDPV